jgi:hypothetical protein
VRSDDLRNYSYVLLMLTLAIVSGSLGLRGYKLVKKAESLTVETQRRITLITEHADRVLTELGQTAKEAREASKVTKEAAIEQKKLIAATSDNVRQASADLDRMILHADASLNGDLVPQISANLASANLELMRASDDIHDTLLASQKVMATADKRLDDPAIAAILKTTSYTSENIAATTKDIRDTVHQAVKPRNKLLTLVQIVFGIGSKAGSMVGGFGR